MTSRKISVFALLGALAATAVHAEGTLVTLHETPAGTYGGVEYMEYSGAFEGTTGTGFYRVPYTIIAPVNPEEGNQSVWVEPAHFAGGLGTLNDWVQRDFVLGRKFSYAGIGWSSFGRSVLDPNPGFVVWIGGVKLDDDEDGSVDEDPIDGADNDGDGAVDEDPPAPAEIQDPAIISDFGAALVEKAEGRRVLGEVENRYAVGFSQTSFPIRGLINSGLADGVFDGVLTFVNAFVLFGSLQPAISSGVYSGKVITVNTEFDTLVFGAGALEDDGTTPDQYRHYAVSGAAHVSDTLLPGMSQPSTPASYIPELRAHFWQLHQWVSGGDMGSGPLSRLLERLFGSRRAPPPSTAFARDASGLIAHDAMNNALTVYSNGDPAPRLPFIELGEATYITGFIGTYANTLSVADLGYASFGSYLWDFARAAAAYRRARFMLLEDEADMFLRAVICPDSTYTENYRDRYEQFVNIEFCR